jgi:hypothetical protein
LAFFSSLRDPLLLRQPFDFASFNLASFDFAQDRQDRAQGKRRDKAPCGLGIKIIFSFIALKVNRQTGQIPMTNG